MGEEKSRRLPDFIIIGAAKAGTTTLHHYLDLNPNIYMSSPKEPCFFSDDDVYVKGVEWYSSLFSSAKPDQACGEASTRYTRCTQYPEAAPRMAELLPHVKLIYIMRHPVDRAYSHHVHEIATGQNKRRTTFEDGIKQHSYILDCSDYLRQIEQYLKFFSRDSFLFLLMEDIVKTPKNTIKEILKFLNIDSIKGLDIDLPPVQKNSARERSESFARVKFTSSLKGRVPGLSKVISVLPKEIRNSGYHLIEKLPIYREYAKRESYLPPPILPETRQMLIERFGKSNQKLSRIVGRDLSHWLE